MSYQKNKKNQLFEPITYYEYGNEPIIIYTPEPETLATKLGKYIYHTREEDRNYEKAFKLLEKNKNHKFDIEEIVCLIQYVMPMGFNKNYKPTANAIKLRDILFSKLG